MQTEDENYLDKVDLDKPLFNKAFDTNKESKKFIIFLVGLNIFLISFVALILLILFKDDNDDEENTLKILKHDKDFIKPNNRLDLEFELVQVQNGMKGLIIRDEFTSNLYAQFQVEYGQLIDTVGGLAHLDEHMIFGGSEKYEYYSIDKIMGKTAGFISNAITGHTYQIYYISCHNQYKYQKAIDIILDAFRYPKYEEKIIAKEVLTINSEFYLGYRGLKDIFTNIIRQLSSNKTSFNGFGVGNNETLRPNESLALSKKLKSYHMVVNRPENFFFVFYSNLTMNEAEQYIENNFNYSMHKFSDDEIDKEEKIKLETNIKNLRNYEIYDENLYQHGFYYNSDYNLNLLDILFHIGNVDYKDLQFDIVEYYEFLLNSKSLLKILKENNYIAIIDNIGVYTELLIENNNKNNILSLEIILTEKGLKELNKVLLIIYKYIDIMKKEGYKKELFENFIKYKNNKIIRTFTRSKIILDMVNSFYYMGQNNLLYGEKQIFTDGTPTMKNYNEKKLKNYLNNMKYEKSFFGLNVNQSISNISTFLESTEIKTLKYYDAKYLLGKMPNDFKNEINNANIEGLKIREINPYFSEKFGKVTPCYRQKPNKCKELNEFDFDKEEEYNGTCLEEKNENYSTCYQIDKSSESFLVVANLKFNLTQNEFFKDDVINEVLLNYLNEKLIEMKEAIGLVPSDSYETKLGFKFKCFSDNIEIALKNFISILKEEPKEYEFEYAKNMIRYQINEYKIYLMDYARKTANFFINKGKKEDRRAQNDKERLEKLDNLTFNVFKDMHHDVINNILSLEFRLAGNIDEDLVQKLHNLIKENIKITPHVDDDIRLFSSPQKFLKLDSSYVIDYYEKSTLSHEVDNAIIVMYGFDKKYLQYMNLLTSCLNNIAMVYLRFEYSNTYTPSIYYNAKYLFIAEQGSHKEVTEMEDDINEVLYGMLIGDIQCENYADIVESFKLKNNQKTSKNMDILFQNFAFGKTNWDDDDSQEEEVVYPDNFYDFMQEMSSIFLEPKRYTILIARKDLPEEDYKQMIDNRKKNAEYKLNKNIKIQHTEEIDYLNQFE